MKYLDLLSVKLLQYEQCILSIYIISSTKNFLYLDRLLFFEYFIFLLRHVLQKVERANVLIDIYTSIYRDIFENIEHLIQKFFSFMLFSFSILLQPYSTNSIIQYFSIAYCTFCVFSNTFF